ncbi:MAG: hypothetical protein QNJ60_11445, partial [Xenococcaceae cyanobacterium MO_188.B19]|nr:hypothetical protein [Xenococcaceae cyanobacterium MO_188.B19]
MANEIFVKRAQQVKALVDSLGDAVVNAASYAEGGVASQLEAGMKKAIPILMSALASYANIGDIPNKIKGVIDKGKNWVNENIKPFINKVIDTVGSLIPDLSGKQLATRITKGLGIGNVYDRVRNYLKPHTQKPFETFNDAKQVVDTAQTVFKPLGINTLNLEQADKTGHSFNVIAAKPLPGRKPVINANPIRISRKPSISNRSIDSKRGARFPKPNNIVSRNSISTIQTNSVSLNAKQSSLRLKTAVAQPKPIISSLNRNQILHKSEKYRHFSNNQSFIQKLSSGSTSKPTNYIQKKDIPHNNLGKFELQQPEKKSTSQTDQNISQIRDKYILEDVDSKKLNLILSSISPSLEYSNYELVKITNQRKYVGFYNGDFKLYSQKFYGNQYLSSKTVNLQKGIFLKTAKVIKIGSGIFTIGGGVLSTIDYVDGRKTGTKLAFDLAFTAINFVPPYGWIASTIYFTITGPIPKLVSDSIKEASRGTTFSKVFIEQDPKSVCGFIETLTGANPCP